MKERLLDFLICPACLPSERALTCYITEKDGDDIISGALDCGYCGAVYPIREGIGTLTPGLRNNPGGAQSKYEDPGVVASYLWSHYADLWGDEDAGTAYRQWGDLLPEHGGVALDAGCAVGRFTFELSRRSDFAVGVDLSHAFIRTARRLARDRTMEVLLPEEGIISESREIRLPEKWPYRKVEFLVGDVQALPFRSGLFSSLSSLNIVDKVPRPGLHLRELNRAARRKEARLLFSDPFSWSVDIAEEKEWLGGTPAGPYAGGGMENIALMLEGKKGGLRPAWRIEKRGRVWWKIRNHRNHFELIRSLFIRAGR